MKLIVCLDDGGGMAFNKRRQSRDSALIDDLKKHLNGAPLWMLPYSAPLLEGSGILCRVHENAPTLAKKNDHCLLETLSPLPFANEINEIVIYRWNRRYPSDIYFDLDLSGFSRLAEVEFVGSSHEKITKEIWKK